MSLTHRLFGIRSCNEVITGKRGRPCLEYDIKRCIAPCVDTICSPEEYGARGRAARSCSSRAGTTSWSKTLHGADARGGRRPSGSRRRRSCAMRCAPCRRCTIASRRWRPPSSAHRDVFGLKLGPAGVVVQVFQVRGGRVVERVELGTERRRSSARATARCSKRRSSSSTSCAARRRRSTCRPSPTSARRSRAGCRSAPAAACGSSCRSAARSAAWSISRTATPRSPTRRASIRRTAAQYDALETLQRRAGAAGAAAPHRVLRHLDDSGQRDRRVDGRVRGRADAARRVSEVSDQRLGPGAGLEPQGRRAASRDPRAPSSCTTTSPRCTKSCGAAIASCSSRADRFPISILIDGGKGQLSAAYAALEELGLANLVAVGIAKKEELLFTRDREEPIALAPNDPALLLLQRIRDEAHRFAVTFHRQRADDARSAVGARRRAGHRPAPAADAADDVRQPGRRPARDARGAGGRRSARKSADAVLAFFAEPAVTCIRSLLGHRLRAALHRLHRSAVFADRARDRRTRGRPIGSAIRRRGCSAASR